MTEEVVTGTPPVEAPATPVADVTSPKAEEAIKTPTDKDKPVETPAEAEPKKKPWEDRRLSRAIRRAAEERARAEFLEKELERVRTSPSQPKDEGAPTLEKFEYDPEKYAQAVADYKLKKAEQERDARQRDETAKQYTQRLATQWEEKVEAAYEKYEDFDEVVGKLEPKVPFVAAIMEADNGPDIAHYLGKNPKEAQRIAQLPPLSQVREIGKLEAKFAAEPVKAKTPSKAPAPITPLTGTTPAPTDEDTGSYESWLKNRNKQLGRKG